jgi:hypothetical protein
MALRYYIEQCKHAWLVCKNQAGHVWSEGSSMPCNHLWGIYDTFAVPCARKSKPIEFFSFGETPGLTFTLLNHVQAEQAEKHICWSTAYRVKSAWRALKNN